MIGVPRWSRLGNDLPDRRPQSVEVTFDSGAARIHGPVGNGTILHCRRWQGRRLKNLQMNARMRLHGNGKTKQFEIINMDACTYVYQVVN